MSFCLAILSASILQSLAFILVSHVPYLISVPRSRNLILSCKPALVKWKFLFYNYCYKTTAVNLIISRSLIIYSN